MSELPLYYKDLLYSTWNSAQCHVMYVYVRLGPFVIHLKISQHCLLISCTPVQNKKIKK